MKITSKIILVFVFVFILNINTSSAVTTGVLSELLENIFNNKSAKKYCYGKEVDANYNCPPLINSNNQVKSSNNFKFNFDSSIFENLFSKSKTNSTPSHTPSQQDFLQAPSAAFLQETNFGKKDNATKAPEKIEAKTEEKTQEKVKVKTEVKTATEEVEPKVETKMDTKTKSIAIPSTPEIPKPKVETPKVEDSKITFVNCSEEIQKVSLGDVVGGKILNSGYAKNVDELSSVGVKSFNSPQVSGACLKTENLFFISMQSFSKQRYGIILTTGQIKNSSNAKVGKCSVYKSNILIKLSKVTGHLENNCPGGFFNSGDATAKLQSHFGGNIYLLKSDAKVEF